MASICIFGDSIGEGYYDSEKGGWVAQLGRYLKTPNEDLSIYNCSISGESTREVLTRFDVEIKARGSKIIIFALGTNDSWYFDNDKNNPNVSLEDFKGNLRLLISKEGCEDNLYWRTKSRRIKSYAHTLENRSLL